MPSDDFSTEFSRRRGECNRRAMRLWKYLDQMFSTATSHVRCVCGPPPSGRKSALNVIHPRGCGVWCVIFVLRVLLAFFIPGITNIGNIYITTPRTLPDDTDRRALQRFHFRVLCLRRWAMNRLSRRHVRHRRHRLQQQQPKKMHVLGAGMAESSPTPEGGRLETVGVPPF